MSSNLIKISPITTKSDKLDKSDESTPFTSPNASPLIINSLPIMSSHSDVLEPLYLDSTKDIQKDTQKDTQKDSTKDIQKDTQKDTQKDSTKDIQKDTQKDSIKITKEIPKKQLAIQAFINTLPSKNLETVQSALYARNIKVSYNEDVIICSLNSTKKKNLDVVSRECNGLILSRPDYNPIVVPSRNLRFNIDTDISNDILRKGLYKIYQSTDGTCFNMYYMRNKWIISTTNGHTMNDIIWENKSYQEVITECLSTYGLSWAQFTSFLNPSHCYSFIFTHYSRHKFVAHRNNPQLRFIQSVCIDPSLPEYLWANEQSPIAVIQPQIICNDPNTLLQKLYYKATNALEDYIANGTICYGFILRSQNVEYTKEHSDLFIESSLMRFIKQNWYDNEIIKSCKHNKLQANLLVTLRAYLSLDTYDNFCAMFPDYDKYMKTYERYINEAVKRMINPKYNTIEPIISFADKMLVKFNDTNSLSAIPEAELIKIYTTYLRNFESFHIMLEALISDNQLNELTKM